MKLVAIIGLLLSVLIAVASVQVLKTFVSTDQSADNANKPKPKTVVVASDSLRYGEKLSDSKVKLVEWYADKVPGESMGTIQELALTDDGPYVLASIQAGSVIRKSQLTAPGQKPSLSSLLAPGTVAVTVPVTTITGVAGFVLPDDRVDIISTRTIPDPSTGNPRKVNDVILEDIKVLAADRVIDAEPGKPVVAKSVTFQVAREDAQKLVLATQVGEVFLTLRSVDRAGEVAHRTVSEKEFNSEPTSSINGTNQEPSTDNKPVSVAEKQYSTPDQPSTMDTRVFRNLQEYKMVVPR